MYNEQRRTCRKALGIHPRRHKPLGQQRFPTQGLEHDRPRRRSLIDGATQARPASIGIDASRARSRILAAGCVLLVARASIPRRVRPRPPAGRDRLYHESSPA